MLTMCHITQGCLPVTPRYVQASTGTGAAWCRWRLRYKDSRWSSNINFIIIFVFKWIATNIDNIAVNCIIKDSHDQEISNLEI